MRTEQRKTNRQGSRRLAALVLSLLVIYNAPITAGAQVTIEDGCMQDTAGFPLDCTANDVSIPSATNIVILDDGCAFPGDTVTFTADFEVMLAAQERHDVGIYFANDGDPSVDGAISGFCTISTVPFEPAPPWVDLDGTNDDPNGVLQDLCGDIDDDHNPLLPSITLTVACVDTNGDEQLDLPYCTTWRQPGANELCLSPLNAFPGAPSECLCDLGFTVPITVPLTGTIEVIKDLTPTGDTGLFKLQIDGMDESIDVGDGGTTGPVAVNAGTTADPGEIHNVGEIAGTGTDLADYDSGITCTDGSLVIGPVAGTGPVDIDVQPDDVWVCTVSNTARLASDTDGDGVLDDVDNCIEIANPLQTDTNLDGIGNVCDPDIGGLDGPGFDDCLVNFSDLGFLKLAFFSTPGAPNWNPHADLGGVAGTPDNQVNIIDLGRMKERFFQPPGPSASGCTPILPGFSGPDAMQNWSSSGIAGGSTSITPPSGPTEIAMFAYDVSLPGGGVTFRTATFSATAPAAGLVSFDYVYSGYHAFFQASKVLQVYADGPGGTQIITLSDGDAPGGFVVSGSASIAVNAGFAFGIIAGGSNFDSDSRLNGTITVTNLVAPE